MFGHNELLALIHALKVQGEKIELQSPSGGSSHYTVLIGVGCYGYIDEEFIEKGKAFIPHNKDFSGFPKHIIESLQNTFTRAGYSPEALGLIPATAAAAAVEDTATASAAVTGTNNKPAKN